MFHIRSYLGGKAGGAELAGARDRHQEDRGAKGVQLGGQMRVDFLVDSFDRSATLTCLSWRSSRKLLYGCDAIASAHNSSGHFRIERDDADAVLRSIPIASMWERAKERCSVDRRLEAVECNYKWLAHRHCRGAQDEKI